MAQKVHPSIPRYTKVGLRHGFMRMDSSARSSVLPGSSIMANIVYGGATEHIVDDESNTRLKGPDGEIRASGRTEHNRDCRQNLVAWDYNRHPLRHHRPLDGKKHYVRCTSLIVSGLMRHVVSSPIARK